MLINIHCAKCIGIEAVPVTVEVDMTLYTNEYRQVTDTVCYEIKLIRAHNPSFSINKANKMNFYARCE